MDVHDFDDAWPVLRDAGFTLESHSGPGPMGAEAARLELGSVPIKLEVDRNGVLSMRVPVGSGWYYVRGVLRALTGVDEIHPASTLDGLIQQVRELVPFYAAGLPDDLQEQMDTRNRELMRNVIEEKRKEA